MDDPQKVIDQFQSFLDNLQSLGKLGTLQQPYLWMEEYQTLPAVPFAFIERDLTELIIRIRGWKFAKVSEPISLDTLLEEGPAQDLKDSTESTNRQIEELDWLIKEWKRMSMVRVKDEEAALSRMYRLYGIDNLFHIQFFAIDLLGRLYRRNGNAEGAAQCYQESEAWSDLIDVKKHGLVAAFESAFPNHKK